MALVSCMVNLATDFLFNLINLFIYNLFGGCVGWEWKWERGEWSSCTSMSSTLTFSVFSCSEGIISNMASPFCSARFQHRRSSFKELQYICDGDSNGVLHFAGTSYGEHQWVNPILAKVHFLEYSLFWSQQKFLHMTPNALKLHVSEDYYYCKQSNFETYWPKGSSLKDLSGRIISILWC